MNMHVIRKDAFNTRTGEQKEAYVHCFCVLGGIWVYEKLGW